MKWLITIQNVRKKHPITSHRIASHHQHQYIMAPKSPAGGRALGHASAHPSAPISTPLRLRLLYARQPTAVNFDWEAHTSCSLFSSLLHLFNQSIPSINQVALRSAACFIYSTHLFISFLFYFIHGILGRAHRSRQSTKAERPFFWLGIFCAHLFMHYGVTSCIRNNGNEIV